MGWLGAIGRVTGHSHLTGPFSGAERRRNLRTDVTTCTLFGAAAPGPAPFWTKDLELMPCLQIVIDISLT